MMDGNKTEQELKDEKSLLRQRIRELEQLESGGMRAFEDVLKDDAGKYRFLAETMIDVVWVLDMELRTVYVSPSIEAALGLTQEEGMKRTPTEQMTPASIARVFEVLAQELERERQNGADPRRTITVELEYYHKDGSTRWFENIIQGMRDGRGTLTGIYGVSRDVTRRKLAEEALRESESCLRAITDSARDAIIMMDNEGRISFWNPAAERILGYSAAEAVGQNLHALIAPSVYHQEYGSAFPVFKQKGLGGAVGKTLELEARRKDGTEISIELSVSATQIKGMWHAVGILRDVSERKQAETEREMLRERLQRAEKMEALGKLAGGVAHDLNNSLGVMSGYAELLLMEIPEGQPGRKHVEKILQSTEKSAAIIQDLLTLARRGVSVSQVMNLNEIVCNFFETPAFENIKQRYPQVRFRMECQEKLLNMKGSPVHLEKTLMNLVSNAAEAVSGAGEVTIQTENLYVDKAAAGYEELGEGDYVVLIVSDTGVGIPGSDRDKIFEPFYTKKTMGGRSGTGLGLSIVWGTVQDHNGHIDVQSKLGEGSAFTLYFPATRQDLPNPVQREPVEQYMGSGEAVLVVDDIAEQREVAAGLIGSLGYQVQTVSSGMEAVEYLKHKTADVVLLDMIMPPGMDGLDTYRKILEIHPKQKALLVSGFSETNRVREAMELGAKAYIRKPYVLESIGLALRDVLNS